MSDRLRPRDLAVLAAESARTPRHNATLEIFDGPGEDGGPGLDFDAFVALVADRIAYVPRYRQRLRLVPGRLANPVWVDDEDFDLGYHVRRSALPSPGSMEQLSELVARISSRRLDRSRPLWEVYVIEGLEHGRVAVFSKAHQVLVDGVHTVDLGQVLLDVHPKTRGSVTDTWRPAHEPGPPALLTRAIGESVRHPSTAATTLRSNTEALTRTAGGLAERALDAAAGLTGRRRRPESPLTATLSEQRRLVTVRTRLEDFRKVRRVHGGTVNDVILATITGAVRAWLMTRSVPSPAGRTIRAMVPMGVQDEELEPTSLGSQVAGHLLELPVGEASPVVRLHQVSYSLTAHRETGKAVAANRLAGVAGFAPTTFHALATQVATDQLRHGFSLVVANVPGPQFPLYAAGARMRETYPVPPLLDGFALSIGVTSYDGSVFFGINADRDAVPDADLFGTCLREALDELLDSADGSQPRAPRGRRQSGARQRAR